MGGKDDPNLDGDFVTLYEIKQRREEERRNVSSVEEELPSVPAPETVADTGCNVSSIDSRREQLKLQRQAIINAAQNDIAKFRSLCDSTGQEIALEDDFLCDEVSKETILHTLLTMGKVEAARILIETGTPEFLTTDYEVIVKNHVSKKSTLHLLCDLGHQELINQLLSRLSKEQRKSYVRKTVLMEITGQRPRHLEAIHIAALNGHTDILEYMVHQLKIDVNTVNVKNDTPVLWAARNNHLETVRLLIKLGADLSQQNDKGSTPLYWACRYGLLDMVRLLINEGKADIHQQRKLGLVSPVVLVAAYGFNDILRELLANGANVNLQIQGGMSPLHWAAQQGNADTISLLLEYKATIDLENDFGDTPMLLAARENEIEAFRILASSGANLDQRNNDGKTVWNYAIEASRNSLLISVAKHFRVQKRMMGKIMFAVGKTPLHLAAAKGDISKIQCLLDLGTEATAVDEGGNTFFHIAARENSIDILKSFLSKVDINLQNTDGNTALHLAASNGNTDAIKLLLEKAKCDIKNGNGETTLHAACRSVLTSSDAIKAIVGTIVNKHNWSLVDAPDRFGNTALHVAARAGRVDIMDCLKQLNPRVINTGGDSPLMVAAKAGRTDVLEIMLEIFKENLLINQQNHDGESLLHVAARQGMADMLELLILAGSDLSLQDNEGSTPLHVIVQQTIKDRDNLLNLMGTVDMIEQYVVRWWCVRNDSHIPDRNSEDYERYHREAYLYLLMDLPDSMGLSVLQYTAKHNALDIFDKLVHTREVFLFKDRGFVDFDVTNLTPDTMVSKLNKTSKVIRKSSSSASVSPLINDTGPEGGQDTMSVSCLELIVHSENLQIANEMLDISPIQQIVKDYWNAYQWIYGFIMIVHIIYMSLLSVYAIPNSPEILATLNTTANVSNGQVFPYILFLIWPALMFLFEVYYISVRIAHWAKGTDKAQNTKYLGVRGKFRAVWDVTWDHLGIISCFFFVSLIVAWFALYVYDSVYQIYVLATAMIIGWLFTIVFTSGFEAVHSYSIMLKQIVIRDITRFLFIYLFILLGFSFAFQTMFSVATDLTDQYPSIWYVFFVVFNMMIGMGEIFDDGFDSYYKTVGLSSGSVYVKVVYLFYVILTTIILLNVLIAMMTDSYADVKAHEGTNWRVGSIRLAIQIEKSIPAISLLKSKRYPITTDKKNLRFLMRIPRSEIKFSRLEDQSETVKMINRMEKELAHMRATLLDMADKMDSVGSKVDSMHSSQEGSPAGRFVKLLRNRAGAQRPGLLSRQQQVK